MQCSENNLVLGKHVVKLYYVLCKLVKHPLILRVYFTQR